MRLLPRTPLNRNDTLAETIRDHLRLLIILHRLHYERATVFGSWPLPGWPSLCGLALVSHF